MGVANRCSSAELFLGVEHPGGVAQGSAGAVRLVDLIGRDLAPGAQLECSSTVIGAKGGAPSVQAAFRRYVLGLRPRRTDRLIVYSPLGWYDYTNPADPLPTFTDDMLDENLSVLAEIGRAGVDFDVYMLDDWWDPDDFTRFRRSTLPSGGASITRRVHARGLRFGMWNATTRAIWTSENAPGLDASIAGGVARSSDVARPADENGEWFWDEEFAFLANGEKRFCLASEPMRGYLVSSVEQHARELGLGVLKFDCATPHCTSSSHDHRAGKYSVRPMLDAIAEAAAAARRGSPDVTVMWYWGWRSPWMLAHGDMMFDKGLKLEAASPASAPAPTYRQGVTLNIDQSTRFGKAIPLALQDSLGVWIGHVAWANRMGRDGWRDAFLLDIARGASVVSLWGDVAMFDGDDIEFLRRALRHLRRTSGGHLETYEVGGDPWKLEPYGYAQPMLGGCVATVHNPSFSSSTIRVDLAPAGLDHSLRLAVRELYPVPGLVAESLDPGQPLELELRPWEVRMVEVVEAGTTAGLDRPTRWGGPQTRTLDLSALARAPLAGDGARTLRGAVTLPELHRHDSLFVLVRLHRDGVWWYHPAPHTLVTFSARLNGPAVDFTTSPTSRARNGPGTPWVTFEIPAGTRLVGTGARCLDPRRAARGRRSHGRRGRLLGVVARAAGQLRPRLTSPGGKGASRHCPAGSHPFGARSTMALSHESEGMRASLTRSQIEQYRDVGYLVVDDFLTPNELIAWRGAAQQAVAQRPHRLPTGDVEQPGLEDNPHVFTQRLNLWKTHEGMRGLMLDHRLGALAAALSGTPAIRLYSDQALFKEPYSSATPWRQESPFLAFGDECVLLWVALTDATPSNGCLHMLPGSHRGAVDRGVSPGASLGGLFDLYPELHSISPVMCPLAAGAAVFLSGWLAFAAGANLTHGRQMALLCDFMPDGARFNGRQNWLTSREVAGLQVGAPLDDDDLFPLIHCVSAEDPFPRGIISAG